MFSARTTESWRIAISVPSRASSQGHIARTRSDRASAARCLASPEGRRPANHIATAPPSAQLRAILTMGLTFVAIDNHGRTLSHLVARSSLMTKAGS